MATVTPEALDIGAPLDATYNPASAGGDKFRPGRNVFVHVRNNSGGAITPTFDTPGTVSGLAIADEAASIPAGEARFFGPFEDAIFRGSDGLVAVTWSASASVEFAVVALG